MSFMSVVKTKTPLNHDLALALKVAAVMFLVEICLIDCILVFMLML